MMSASAIAGRRHLSSSGRIWRSLACTASPQYPVRTHRLSRAPIKIKHALKAGLGMDARPMEAAAQILTDEELKAAIGWATRLGAVLTSSSFKRELEDAVTSGKRIIFTGHSLGGAVATLAALMLLNSARLGLLSGGSPPHLNMACCTFAAPLVGSKELGVAVAEMGWHTHFLHIVRRHDIVPRLLLSPSSALTNARGMLKDGALRGLQALLKLLNKSEQEDLAVLNAEVVDGCRKEFEAGRNHSTTASRSGQSSAQERPASRSSYLAEVVENLVSGATAGGVYRPFGTFLLHTSSGSMMCHEPAEALQMLYVTMIKQSTAVDTRALDVVEEHFGDRYQVAVDAIIASNTLQQPKWRSLDFMLQDTSSLIELGMMRCAKDLMQAQAEMMDILKKAYQRPPEWYEREHSWLAAQDSMDIIFEYRDVHAAAGEDYCEAFKAYKTKSDKDVERARRVLRVFWDTTTGMYAGGDLPKKFFERGVWLIRARTYMELVEPIEIANYYRCKNWTGWPKGQRHYIEGKRPKRFAFFEAQFAQHYPDQKLAPVLERAQREADAVEAAESREQ
ncbi:hypothetical protein WJX75_004516 [Coccomyxa subellipsoidea]|uniref:Alpha/beta-hydrolase n=1 Tax=Coccomyxa subellipsoidea TaxID=248742 RepID=A0ABR2YC58_9CHLO